MVGIVLCVVLGCVALMNACMVTEWWYIWTLKCCTFANWLLNTGYSAHSTSCLVDIVC